MFEPEFYSENYKEVFGVKCYIPEVPDLEEIEHWEKPKDEQYWRRQGLPEFKAFQIDFFSGDLHDPDTIIEWDTARREEIIKQTGCDPWKLNKKNEPMPVPGVDPDPFYVSQPLHEFRARELEKCCPWPYKINHHGDKVKINNGHWIFINGEATWLTPFEYFFLRWWCMDTGYPDFRAPIHDMWYAWQWVVEHPTILGMTLATKRGCGKTYMGTAALYLLTIYQRQALGGIQSKTEEDARDTVFKNKLVGPYKRLPDFFIPINDNPTEPKNTLNFFAESRKGKNKNVNSVNNAIDSKIDFRNAKEGAYDGETLVCLMRDEEGKCPKNQVDVAKRHEVTLDCVWRDNKKRGVIWSGTTVEETEKGGEQYKVLWDAANQYKMDAKGNTKNRMIRVFLPAHHLDRFDKFGFPDIEENVRDIKFEREMKKDDSEALLNYMLKYPMHESDLWRAEGMNCPYNVHILRQVEAQYGSDPDVIKRIIRVGDFIPTGDFGSPIRFVDNPANGKWHVSWLFPDEKKANRFRRKGTIYVPLNDAYFSAGFDPTKTHKRESERRSNAAGAIYRKVPDPFDERYGETFVADFVHEKPLLPDEPWEEFLYGCMYYGCGFLPEANLGIPRLIEQLGMEDFIIWNPLARKSSQFVPGLDANTPSNDAQQKLMKAHIQTHGWKLKHPRIIKDSISYDPGNRTKFDLGVASQLAITSSTKEATEPTDTMKVTDIVPVWNNAGEIGVMEN